MTSIILESEKSYEEKNNFSAEWKVFHTFCFSVCTFYLVLLFWMYSNFLVINNSKNLYLSIPIDNIYIYIALFILQGALPAVLFIFGYRGLDKYFQYNLSHTTNVNSKTACIIINRYAVLILHICPVVHIISIIVSLISVYPYIIFSKDEILGAYLIQFQKGLAFPSILELSAIGKSIVICLITLVFYLLVQISLKLTLRKEIFSKRALFISILEFFMFFIAFAFLYGHKWIYANFGTIAADQIIFHLLVPLKGVNNDFIRSFLIGCITPALILSISAHVLYSYLKRRDAMIRFHILGYTRNITFHPQKVFIAIPAILLITCAAFFLRELDLINYIKKNIKSSNFIEENYKDPKEVNIVFPEKKRNLIYIFMESMEATFFSYNLGGYNDKNIIPELAELAQNNTSFSNGDNLGGAIQLSYTGWTIASMVSQHAGIPLRIPVENNSYGKYQSFLPGAYTLGDILNEQGYNQTLLVGSDAEFGGRKDYYEQHGHFKILDYFTAQKDGIIPPDYYVWWGYEDKRLYEYAKKELLDLSSQDEPFNLTMLTVDTHHIGGYVCPSCQNKYQTQYFNVYSCASRQISEFIEWIKLQDFYQNTTIVISGDHLSMDPMVNDLVDNKNYTRTIYNVFINPTKTPIQTNNRLFSTMDMFTTTLSSLGVSIEGNRLALGTDLFSITPTMLEEKGIETVSNGLYGSSKIYNSILYGN